MVQWKLYDRKQHHNTPSSIKGFRHVKVECVCQQNSQTSRLIIACAYTARSVCGRQIRTFCQLLWTSERKADKVGVFFGIEKRLLERGRGGALHKRRVAVKRWNLVKTVSCWERVISIRGREALWKWSWIIRCCGGETVIKTQCSNTCSGEKGGERQRSISGIDCVFVRVEGLPAGTTKRGKSYQLSPLRACVCVCCRRGWRRSAVLSVLSHTEKIKVLMAQAASNGTPDFVCVRVYVRSPRKASAAFKPSLIHDCIIPWPNLCVSIYSISLIPGHVGIQPLAAAVWGAAECRRLIPKWWVLLPGTQPTYSSCCRCWGKERRKKSYPL